MEQYLNSGIKEIISKFPAVAGVLDTYNIGCVPCSVGTCLLKDIVNIHDLSEDEEKELFRGLGEIFNPGGEVKLPVIGRKEKSAGKKPAYSPPMKTLADEHLLIMRMVALIPLMTAGLDLSRDDDRKDVLDGVDFIRSYADRYHHAKEEDILFRYFDPNLDIVKVMLDDHTTGRNHVKKIVEAVEGRDGKSAAEHLGAYARLLSEHIKKEDDVLYPWMDRNLTTREIGDMYAKFSAVEMKFGGSPAKYEALIHALEKKYC